MTFDHIVTFHVVLNECSTQAPTSTNNLYWVAMITPVLTFEGAHHKDHLLQSIEQQSINLHFKEDLKYYQ